MNERFQKEQQIDKIEWHNIFGTYVVNKESIDSIDGLKYYSEYVTVEEERDMIRLESLYFVKVKCKFLLNLSRTITTG